MVALLQIDKGMGHRVFIAGATLALGSATMGCATLGARASTEAPADARRAVIARAQVWNQTDIPSMDLKRGPRMTGAFPFRATVRCDYVDKALSGSSPKFACKIGHDDEVKVKFGAANGEVYGEVLATRLLWALGFGADGMYPVNVICRGCPSELGGIERPGGESRFDPAVIERKMPGREWSAEGDDGWSWRELDEIAAAPGGAPRAHRDALTLLAVFLQHSDSKPEQQRIVCRGGRGESRDACARPMLIINDLGLTFGGASRTNANSASSVNLSAWRRTPVWKAGAGCTGNLPKSFSGTLENPEIGEEGRRFLAGLLAQLTDRQIRDLFEVARVELRLRAPRDASSEPATVAEWIDAFKEKRAQIFARRCL